DPSCPLLGRKRCKKSDGERPERGRGGPAVPVHRRRKEPHRGIDDVSRTVCAPNDKAERRVNGEQCQILRERKHVKHSECSPEGKREPAERTLVHHAPNPLMLFVT